MLIVVIKLEVKSFSMRWFSINLYFLCTVVCEVYPGGPDGDSQDIWSSLTRKLYVVIYIEGVQSWEEVSQEVLLVDLTHLIPWHLLHQHQACGDGVGHHVLPAINTDVNTVKTVYCRKEDKHRQACTKNTQPWSMCTYGWEYAHAHIFNNGKKQNNNCKTKTSPVAEKSR